MSGSDCSIYSEDSGNDTAGSLNEFIVDSSSEHEETPVFSEPKDATEEVAELLQELTEEQKKEIFDAKTRYPKRKRKAAIRYVDPNYAKLMELDRLSSNEKDYILNEQFDADDETSDDEEEIQELEEEEEEEKKQKRKKTTRKKKRVKFSIKGRITKNAIKRRKRN